MKNGMNISPAVKMNAKPIKIISAIILWGAVWGLTEATIGYAFHIVTLPIPGITGFILFPLAYYFMMKVKRHTGNSRSIYYIAFIAAAVKLTDLFIPGSIPIKVINPAVSIIMEGMVVFGTISVLQRSKIHGTYAGAFIMSLLWRLAYAAYLFILLSPQQMRTSPIGSSMLFFKFIFLESLVNCFIICFMDKSAAAREKSVMERSLNAAASFAFSFVLLALALLAERMM